MSSCPARLSPLRLRPKLAASALVALAAGANSLACLQHWHWQGWPSLSGKPPQSPSFMCIAEYMSVTRNGGGRGDEAAGGDFSTWLCCMWPEEATATRSCKGLLRRSMPCSAGQALYHSRYQAALENRLSGNKERREKCIV